jgi:hypothetical protein
LDSKQVQQSQQLIYYLNMLLTMYAPMELPQSSKNEVTPYLGNPQLLNFGRYAGPFTQQPAITACESDQSNRLPINVGAEVEEEDGGIRAELFPESKLQGCKKVHNFL